MSVVTLIAPVFGLMALGWLAAAAGLISPKVGEGLSEYVFALAVPALIVATLTRPSLAGHVTPSYWLAYFGGAFFAWAVGWLIARRPQAGRDRRGAIVQGFSCSQSNTIFVGVPLILQAYGDDGAFPLFMLLAVHLPIMMGAATILVEADGSRSIGAQAAGLARTLSRNGIVQGLCLGLALKLSGMGPGGVAKTLLDGVASTASPCALIALGAGLGRLGSRRDLPGALVITVLKLGLHPLAVWVLAFHVFSMPPAFAGVATLFAAMPVGINSYLLAARYNADAGIVSTAVVTSTLVSVVTTVGWLALLGRL